MNPYKKVVVFPRHCKCDHIDEIAKITKTSQLVQYPITIDLTGSQFDCDLIFTTAYNHHMTNNKLCIYCVNVLTSKNLALPLERHGEQDIFGVP